LGMKNKLLRPAVILGISACAFASCHDHGIVILPKNGKHHDQIEANWERIEKILKQHPKLYYVETYKDGKLDPKHPPAGELCDILLVPKLASVHDAAEKIGFTGHAVQAGAGVSASFDLEEFLPDGVHSEAKDEVVKMPQPHRAPFATESQKMVQDINERLRASGKSKGGQ
jgi:hypothetical protein